MKYQHTTDGLAKLVEESSFKSDLDETEYSPAFSSLKKVQSV